MYKRIIGKIVEEKVIETQEEERQKLHQARISNTKYDISSIFVGYIAKRAIQTIRGKDVLKQMVNTKAILLYPVELEYFKDIEEIDKYYPLLRFDEKPDNDNYYISERFINSFVNKCSETLIARGISEDAKLTIKELREIMQQQENLKQIYFN